MHYLGQWLFLKAERVPLFGFRFGLFAIRFKYVATSITTAQEIGVVALGPLADLAVFGALVGFAMTAQALVRKISDTSSKFLAAWGFGCLVDPLLVLLVDLLEGNYDCAGVHGAPKLHPARARRDAARCAADYTADECGCVEGDFIRLWTRLELDESGGPLGLLYTLILYAMTATLALLALYSYAVRVHMNGRMMDTYRRIHGTAESFFVPHDFEMSLGELNAIVAHAKRWRGSLGTQRRVVVSGYELRDPLCPSFVEESTHVAIYKLEYSGERTLHRHFLRTHDGAIIELFGDAGHAVGGEYKQLESLLLSEPSAADPAADEDKLPASSPAGGADPASAGARRGLARAGTSGSGASSARASARGHFAGLDVL